MTPARPRTLLSMASVAVAFAAADTYVVVLALPEMMAAVGVPIDALQKAAPIVSGFLLGYVAYHFVHGDTKYAGAFRPVYLSILATHVLASLTVLPLALTAFYFAGRREFARHAKVTRVLWPIWLYVSVTGVVVFFMLHG